MHGSLRRRALSIPVCKSASRQVEVCVCVCVCVVGNIYSMICLPLASNTGRMATYLAGRSDATAERS